MKEVVVVIGPGQIGQAIARRVGMGRYLLLADAREENTRAAAEVLGNAGFEVDVAAVDISSRGAVEALVQRATALGSVRGALGLTPKAVGHLAATAPVPGSAQCGHSARR